MGPARHNRLVDIQVIFQGCDSESFAENETIRIDDQFKLPLNPRTPTNSRTLTYKWGGECRSEFLISVTLRVDYSVIVNVNGWLYEGTSEETDDLDGVNCISIAVPEDFIDPGATGMIQIDNLDDSGGDFGRLWLTVKNFKNNV
jgi:hypothetical protein